MSGGNIGPVNIKNDSRFWVLDDLAVNLPGSTANIKALRVVASALEENRALAPQLYLMSVGDVRSFVGQHMDVNDVEVVLSKKPGVKEFFENLVLRAGEISNGHHGSVKFKSTKMYSGARDSERLRELCDLGVVQKQSNIPGVKVAYFQLTEKGLQLAQKFELI